MTVTPRHQKTLSIRRLQFATRWLSARDDNLRHVFEKYGYPPLWDRPPGFESLVYIVLGQQVSLASAEATYQRLKGELDAGITPAGIMRLSPTTLRQLGFSRQKTAYIRSLAESTNAGFSFEALQHLDDHAARLSLLQHKGVGNWTADIYLSECLLRCDVLPPGDIAMQEAFRVLYRLENRPTHEQFEAQTQHWRPWRSVATRLLWHYYLSEKAVGR